MPEVDIAVTTEAIDAGVGEGSINRIDRRHVAARAPAGELGLVPGTIAFLNGELAVARRFEQPPAEFEHAVDGADRLRMAVLPPD